MEYRTARRSVAEKSAVFAGVFIQSFHTPEKTFSAGPVM